MAQSAKKLNFMIRNDIARELEDVVPPGERSKVVNEALAKELAAIRRKALTDRLRAVREKSPSLATTEIVATLRKDRKRT